MGLDDDLEVLRFPEVKIATPDTLDTFESPSKKDSIIRYR
jgi:hypothetical protein